MPVVRPFEGPCREVLLQTLKAAPLQRISFAEWMELALYHPTCGYYVRAQDKIGRQHDFITSSHVHSVFGKFWGARFAAWAGEKALELIELGPGEGRLMGALLDYMRDGAPNVYGRLTVYLYEISPYHRMKIKERLADHRAQLPIVFIDDLSDVPVKEARRETDLCRIVFSNEFWDAHPVERLRFLPEGGFERQVVRLQDDDRWQLAWEPFALHEPFAPHDPFDSSLSDPHKDPLFGEVFGKKRFYKRDAGTIGVDETEISMPAAQIGEVLRLMGFHQDWQSTLRWLQEEVRLPAEELSAFMDDSDLQIVIEVPVLAYKTYQTVLGRLAPDTIVSIDYGADQVGMILKALRGGSLRAFYAHTIRDDFWQYPGLMDMTVDVPFHLFIRAGESSGYETLAFKKQGAYLTEQGIFEWLRTPQDHDPFSAEARQNRAIVQLIQPGGMGDAFYVLLQKRHA
ncbi:MAG: SAM-dependent methyltransferase [Candidatus Carbobacillus altaicus]|nr:SAM-dependent methyltransferase [Candidatus Carbobacillus altaicus]